MFDKDDYVEFLNRARKKRNQNPYTMYIVFGVGVILALSLIIGGVVLMIRQLSGSEEAAESKQISEMQESTLDPVAESRAAEDLSFVPGLHWLSYSHFNSSVSEIDASRLCEHSTHVHIQNLKMRYQKN